MGERIQGLRPLVAWSGKTLDHPGWATLFVGLQAGSTLREDVTGRVREIGADDGEPIRTKVSVHGRACAAVPLGGPVGGHAAT